MYDGFFYFTKHFSSSFSNCFCITNDNITFTIWGKRHLLPFITKCTEWKTQKFIACMINSIHHEAYISDYLTEFANNLLMPMFEFFSIMFFKSTVELFGYVINIKKLLFP